MRVSRRAEKAKVTSHVKNPRTCLKLWTLQSCGENCSAKQQQGQREGTGEVSPPVFEVVTKVFSR